MTEVGARSICGGQEHLWLSLRRGRHSFHPQGLLRGCDLHRWHLDIGEWIGGSSWPVGSSLAGNLCPSEYSRERERERLSWKQSANQDPGIRREVGFMAAFSWAEKGTPIRVKCPPKAFRAFFGESHLGRKHQSTYTRQTRPKPLVEAHLCPSLLPLSPSCKTPCKKQGRQQSCPKTMSVAHFVFISCDGVCGVR